MSNIAKEILLQLGNNKFIAMTGAKNIYAVPNGISMRIPRAKNGINYIEIRVNGNDLYDISFGKIRKFDFNIVNEVTDVFVEDLHETFTEHTGLYTKLF